MKAVLNKMFNIVKAQLPHVLKKHKVTFEEKCFVQKICQ